MANFVNVDRETDYLFPPSMSDWLPEHHLARFVVEVVDQLDLTAKAFYGLGISIWGSGNKALLDEAKDSGRNAIIVAGEGLHVQEELSLKL